MKCVNVCIKLQKSNSIYILPEVFLSRDVYEGSSSQVKKKEVMHDKTMIINHEKVVFGSFNYTKSGVNENIEIMKISFS
jgi:phosphatidylserine/phosphatidylglycerophosphate/cardiolipin synthase-like enzyme